MPIAAPVYPPAIEYVAPVAQPFEFSSSNVTLGELMSAPATRDILFKAAPILKMITTMESFHMHLFNFTVGSFVELGIVNKSVQHKIDEQLATVPPADRPKL